MAGALSAGAVTLPVALSRLLRAFKRRGGTGAPIAPPFPKSLRDPTRGGLGKSHLLPALGG